MVNKSISRYCLFKYKLKFEEKKFLRTNLLDTGQYYSHVFPLSRALKVVGNEKIGGSGKSQML
jgi:hypothetical protein